MNKKSISIMLTASVLAVLIACIGVFSVSAYVPDATEETIKVPDSSDVTEFTLHTFPTRPEETTVPPATEPTAAENITKEMLGNELRIVEYVYFDMTGYILGNTGALYAAYQKGLEIYNEPNATQEQINAVYHELIAAENNIYIKGWTAAPYLKGDMNKDQQVNVLDATEIQILLASGDVLDDIRCNQADVNNDMRVDIMDATNIQLYCAGEDNPENHTGTYTINYYYYNR